MSSYFLPYFPLFSADYLISIPITGPHLGLWRLVPGLKVSPRLADQVESQLQIRVLQEVELLRVRLESSTPTVLKRSTSSAHRRGAALRRLTEDELGALSQTGQIAGSSTGTDDIAAFLDIQGIEGESGKAKPEMEFDQNLPSLAIPTFRISELFPTAQHDEVSKALRKVLAVERIEARRAYKHRKRMEEESSASASLPDSEPTKNRSVASNILALSTWPEVSDDGEHKVGEKGLPLAVALWRLRGWYGEGWEEFAIDSRFKRI